MIGMQLKVSEIPLTLEKARFIETCAKWRNYPPRPAIYILAAKKPFNWGSEENRKRWKNRVYLLVF
ncbi:hypothetical protein DRO69_13100 [Candidatus Bathyarchaeota archaeon]|nr:MAG: hypothetical protein DRO69_13100 [Candidatus Bathyarchaeota archaeon]